MRFDDIERKMTEQDKVCRDLIEAAQIKLGKSIKTIEDRLQNIRMEVQKVGIHGKDINLDLVHMDPETSIINNLNSFLLPTQKTKI